MTDFCNLTIINYLEAKTFKLKQYLSFIFAIFITHTKGTPADASGDELKLRLQTLPGMGIVDVNDGDVTCAEKNWFVEWRTVGGDRPNLVFVSITFNSRHLEKTTF